MDYSVEPKVSSRREQASNVKGRARTPGKSRSERFQDRQRVDVTSGQTCIERNNVSRRNADDVPVVRRDKGKHRKQGSGSDIKKDDELVKHMSNLPGYLQKKERGEDVQGNVLSFGVLDWKRLENWKSNEKFIPSRRYTIASSSGSDTSCMAGGSSTYSSAARQRRNYVSQRTQAPANVPRPNSSHEERSGVRSQGKVTKLQGYEAAQRSNVDVKRNLYAKDKFSGIYIDREKRSESHNRNKSAREHSSLDRRKEALSTSSHVTERGQEFKTNSVVSKEIDVPRQSCEHESIVLLLPKSSPSKCGSGTESFQLPKFRNSVDKNIEVHSNPCDFPPEEELHYLELDGKMPHSSPLPRRVATNVKPCSPLDDVSGMHQMPKEMPTIPLCTKDVEIKRSRLDPLNKTRQTLNHIMCVEPVTPSNHLSCSNTSKMAINPFLKEGTSVPQSDSSSAAVESGPVRSESYAGLEVSSRGDISASSRAISRNSTTTDSPGRLDQDTSEQPATVGRHTSPGRRFTFSWMTKSLNFKESTSLPPLSSPAKVKSGPLISEAFRGLDEIERHNAIAGNSAQLSPLTTTETPRRLDQHLAEQPDTVGQPPSPGRFSFSRMTRSFSSKEGPSVPCLTTSCAAKSRAVGSDASDTLDKLDRDKLSLKNSARFSLSSSTAETPRIFDHYVAEQPNTGGRHLSPSRRFSFSSRPKISRSLDFKEAFSGPQLSSYATVKSKPAGLRSSAGLDKFNQHNVSSSNRARSSPLRRLLDPLLRPRVVNSAETVKPSEEKSTSASLKPVTASELLQNQKHESSNVQALLQLTRKNGLPLFKLVVENGTDILAAAVKQLPAPGDDASSLIYALYSVHEIKNKNGGWMSQGSRGKRSSFGYNVIGQMKVSNSSPLDYSGCNVNYQFMSRECVLYSVEIEQGNKDMPELKPSKELAAILIKNPYQKDKNGKQGNDNLCSEERSTEPFLENACNGRETGDSSSTTVILGGVHGLPDKVMPSPSLVWRYGGSCDCGGWDVGCKLQILTTQDQKRNSRLSSSCCTGLDLFFKGGHHVKRPCFSLAPFKTGVYSVEFDSSISLLQSFFISVAFLSCQKQNEIFEGMLDSNTSTEPKIDAMKFPTALQKDISAKYVTKPPASPVGRV
ncbi:hypothetical protein ACET3Z_027773 [Daucus carota]